MTKIEINVCCAYLCELVAREMQGEQGYEISVIHKTYFDSFLCFLPILVTSGFVPKL